MSSRSNRRVRVWVAALGLTLVAAVAAPGAVAASGPPAAPPAATWSHNPASPLGPQFWSSLDPAWAACVNPDGQSPVVVNSADEKMDLPVLQANYARTPLVVENTGHVVEVPQPDDDGGTLAIGAAPGTVTYHLQQWHIHAPAEHLVNGHRADLEIHLVHSDGNGHTAVLAVFADIVAGQHGKGSAWRARCWAGGGPGYSSWSSWTGRSRWPPRSLCRSSRSSSWTRPRPPPGFDRRSWR